MANYTQPEITRPSISSSYLDEGGRQIQMSIYNPLFKGNTKEYISYSIMGITASLAISSSERTPNSSPQLYSGSVFLLSGSAAFTCGISLESSFNLSAPRVTFKNEIFSASVESLGPDSEENDRTNKLLKGRGDDLDIGITNIKGRDASKSNEFSSIEGPITVTTGSEGSNKTGSIRIEQGATLKIVDGVNFTITYGCTDPTSLNYNPSANTDNGTCIPHRGGCTDPTAYNYNPGANVDDGSCGWFGCTDPTAINYDERATINNGACHYAPLSGEVKYQEFWLTDDENTVYDNIPNDIIIQPIKKPRIVIEKEKEKTEEEEEEREDKYPKSQVKQRISKGQKFVLSTTGEVYKGPYYLFKRKNNKLFGKKIMGNAPLLKPKKFENNSIISSRNGDRIYTDTNNMVTPSLPQAYNLPKNGGQKCINCVFNKNKNCSKWNAQIRNQYWCASWNPEVLLIYAGDTFRYYYPGIIQKGFHTKGNQFLLPNNNYYIGNYHILPDGTYKTDNSSNAPFGTLLTLKHSLTSGIKKHSTKIFHPENKIIKKQTQQTTTTTTTVTQPLLTQRTPLPQNQTQIVRNTTSTTNTTNNTSGTGTSYSY
mgnify:FL=1